MPSSARLLFLCAAVLLAACGPGVNDAGDDGGDDAMECSGDAARCLGNLYQVCEGGTFVTGEACQQGCNEALGGCVACDPVAGNGCDGNNVVSCNADGTPGGVVETCTDGTACSAGECTRMCTADGVDLIYVVDEMYRLLSFDPRLIGTPAGPFELLGTLACPAAGTPVPGWLEGVTPFSMSVDRDGFAWVLYTSGEIFRVDISNPASCTNSGFVPQQNNEWLLFGMGFVTDTAGGNTERLFIGGGDPAAEPGGLFGSVEPASLMIENLGNLPASGEFSPEFTGTGSAELFGFFPGSGTAFVQGINKTNGMGEGAQMSIPGGLGGTVSAWAFAQWGGKFYLFVTTTDFLGAENSTVRRIDKATGAYDGVIMENLPYVIVGAGVSTCAPVVVD